MISKSYPTFKNIYHIFNHHKKILLIKYKTLKKKAQTVKPITVKKAVGAVSYKKTSGKKFFTVNSKTGKVTVKKGTKKGTYTLKVKIIAKGNKEYKTGSKTVKVNIKVK